MTSQLWWYTARASGIVAWGLLAASVLWGLALSTRALGPRPRPNWLLDLHRFLGAAGVVFVGIHVTSLVADSYVHFGLTEVLVPLASSWHPVAVAWGITSFYLLLAVELTSLLRRHLSRRLWRATHFLSFPLFLTATVHLLSAGTDRRNLVLRLTVLLVVVAVASLTVMRVAASRRSDAPQGVEVRGGATRATSPRAAAVAAAAAAARAQRPQPRRGVPPEPPIPVTYPTDHRGWPTTPPTAPPRAVPPAAPSSVAPRPAWPTGAESPYRPPAPAGSNRS